MPLVGWLVMGQKCVMKFTFAASTKSKDLDYWVKHLSQHFSMSYIVEMKRHGMARHTFKCILNARFAF